MKTSELQKARAAYQPKLPKALQGSVVAVEGAPTQSVGNQDEIKTMFPNTYGMPVITFEPGEAKSLDALNVGIILSGGQAPGGHNVISGLYDGVKSLNANSKLYGFLMGPGGLVDHKYVEFNDEFIDEYRNTGGFDIIGSGRTKLEKESQFESGIEILRKLNIKALVIIGGDDSNTNACVLAEYSACKYGHFIKLMGRSASHIALECALETQPNVCLISEEIEQKSMSLDDVVTYIAKIVADRAAVGNDFGTVLIPEGLIEFIPAIKKLIAELNEVLTDPATGESREFASKDEQVAYVKSHILPENLAILESLPKDVERQLCLDRDPHGNVQVSLIETEKLLSAMVAAKLDTWKEEGKYNGKFAAQHHFFGYEGRCAAPSNYDADYCYSLGFNASRLIANDKTGYMSVIKNTTAPAEEWIAGGVPITMMMNMERRNGAMKPVIRKALVELEGAPYKFFASKREEWAKNTCYIYPGPIQYWGPTEVCDQTTKTLALEQSK